MHILDKISPRKRGKKGEGRQVHFVPINVPKDVAEDLKLCRSLYGQLLSHETDENGNPVPEKVSFETMFRHWIDNIGSFDPQVKKSFDKAKEMRSRTLDAVATDLGITAEQLVYNRETYFPTEEEVLQLRFFFAKDGEEIEAVPGTRAPFYALIDGHKVGMRRMMEDDWILTDEIGKEYSFHEARKLNDILRKHGRL